ncbi:MAG: hypothetical protein CMK59_07595 [Proteobacteria bacterium]|nr:hypothetical protein [Pseudomonadota bacterium]
MWLMLGGCLPESATLVVEDRHNFEFSSSVYAAQINIIAQEDALVDWSGLQVDMLGNTIDGVVEKISVLLFPRLGTEEVLFGLSNETLRQSDLSGYVEYWPEEEEFSAPLTDFSMQGTYVNPEEHLLADNGSYLLTFSSSPNVTHSMAFFHPAVDVSNNFIEIKSESASVDYEIDLVNVEPIVVPDAQRWLMDWGELTQSGTDRPLNLNQLDRIQILGTQSSLEEVELEFLRMESLAEQLYEANILGRQSIPLLELKDPLGASIEDFDPSLQWIVALRCSTCVNPAPLFVGVLIQE